MRHLIACAALLLGCGKDGGAAATSGPKGTPDAAPAPVVTPQPTVFFIGGKNRLIVGDADGYRRLGGDDDQFFRVIARPDGTAWVGGSAGLHRYDGASLTPVDAGGLGKASPTGVSKDGVLWVLGDEKVARFDGKAWASWPHDDLGGPAGSRVGRMTVAPDGKAYVPRGGNLVIGDGAAWRQVPAPDGMQVTDVAIDGAGRIFTAVMPMKRTTKDQTTIFELRGDALAEVGKTKGASSYLATQLDGSILIGISDGRIVDGAIQKLPSSIVRAIAADGTAWGDVSLAEAVVAIGPDGKQTRYPAKGDFEAAIVDIVPERGGRVWIVLQSGLAVVEGGALTLLPPETIPELPFEMREVAIGGDAVPLPPFPAPFRITLKGKFVGKDGAPRKGVKVEICEGVSMTYYGRSPCDGKKPTWRATSGADGTFTVADLPSGGWAINYAAGKEWVVRLDYTWKDVGNERLLDDFQL